MLQNEKENTAELRILAWIYCGTIPSALLLTNNSPVRCNLSGCPALSQELFSAGAPAPACACSNRGAAGDSSPTVTLGPLSAGAAQTVI